MIELRGVQRLALAGVDLRVEEGQVILLSGPSGAGKSTLVNLLCGLDRAEAGTVRVFGRDVARLRESSRRLLRRTIGLVPQGLELLDDRTVADNLAIVLRIRGVRRRDRHELVMEALARVGLEAHARERVEALPWGQRQKLVIARALLEAPALVVADEPSSFLGGEDTAWLAGLIAEAAAEGVTCLVATSDQALLAAADEHAWRHLELRDGYAYENGVRCELPPEVEIELEEVTEGAPAVAGAAQADDGEEEARELDDGRDAVAGLDQCAADELDEVAVPADEIAADEGGEVVVHADEGAADEGGEVVVHADEVADESGEVVVVAAADEDAFAEPVPEPLEIPGAAELAAAFARAADASEDALAAARHAFEARQRNAAPDLDGAVHIDSDAIELDSDAILPADVDEADEAGEVGDLDEAAAPARTAVVRELADDFASDEIRDVIAALDQCSWATPEPADASPADASPADASPADASPADASPADASPEDIPPGAIELPERGPNITGLRVEAHDEFERVERTGEHPPHGAVSAASSGEDPSLRERAGGSP